MIRLFLLAVLFLMYANSLSAQTADTLSGKNKIYMHSSLPFTTSEIIVASKKDSHWMHPHWWCWKCWKRGAFSGKPGARPTKEQKAKMECVFFVFYDKQKTARNFLPFFVLL